MCNEALTWAWANRAVKGTAKLVLVRLADFAGQRGESWPTLERIERDTGLGEDALREAIKTLIRASLIYRTAEWRSSNTGGRRSYEYVVLYDEKARAHAIDKGWHEGFVEVNASKTADLEEETDAANCCAEPPAAQAGGDPGNIGVKPPGDPGNVGVAAQGATPVLAGRDPGNIGVAYKEEPSRTIISPPPPKGGVGDASLFVQFKTLWPFDAQDLAHGAQKRFAKLSRAEQQLAVKWAPAYLAAASRSGRKRMTAESWLHRKGWQAFKAQADSAARPSVWIQPHTPQWRAWEIYLAAHGSPSVKRDAHGRPQLVAIQMQRGLGRFVASEWPPTRPDAAEEAPKAAS